MRDKRSMTAVPLLSSVFVGGLVMNKSPLKRGKGVALARETEGGWVLLRTTIKWLMFIYSSS